MSITTDDKLKMYKEYGGTEKNTGSTEGNVAVLTARINHMSEHLRTNKKDFANQRSLQILVGKRKRLLKYLAVKDIATYRTLIEKLNLRK